MQPDGSVFSLRQAPPCPISRKRLRTLVLDYLLKSCAVETAEAFVRDWPDEEDEDPEPPTQDVMDIEQGLATASTSNGHTDKNGHDKAIDGLSPYLSAQTRRRTTARREIRKNVLCGRIQAAVDLCNLHFPVLLRPSDPPSARGAARPLSTSLSPSIGGHSRSASLVRPLQAYKPAEVADPALLSLDLQIQMFIESVRNAATSLSSVGGSTAMGDHLALAIDGDGASSISSSGSTLSYSAFSHALALAQTLHAQASALPTPAHRARYLKELENVSGLIAYQNPEESPVKRFLDVERRAELANGLDKAILLLLGEQPETVMERAVRHTEAVWKQLATDRVPFPPERGKEKQIPSYTFEIQLADFLSTLHSD